MKSTNLKIFLLILCLASCIVLMTIREPDSLYGMEYDVRIINGFTNNSSLPLVVWCSAGERDMGGRALQEGDDYAWSFRTKFWDTTTLFFCTMKWDRKRKSFPAFHVGRHRNRCGPLRKCLWLVKEDGFYFSNDETNWKKDFLWA